MEFHRVLGHLSLEITRETARMAGKHRLHAPRRAGVRGYISALGKLQAIPQELKRGIIGTDLSGDKSVEDPSEQSGSGSDSGEREESPTIEEGHVRPRPRQPPMVKNVRSRAGGEGIRAISSQSMPVPACTKRERGRHRCGSRG